MIVTSFSTESIAKADNDIPSMELFSEQISWVFARRDGGRLYKRLWSNTYGKWLTGWILVEE